MNAVEVALALIRRFEGLYRGPYICPAGVPTIGYGATYYENGVRVTLHDPIITKERAEQLLLWHVSNVYLPALIRLCPSPLPSEVAAALIDFIFNLGAGAFKGSTLRKKVLEENWDALPFELRKWIRGGGKPLRGLILRREAEIVVIESKT